MSTHAKLKHILSNARFLIFFKFILQWLFFFYDSFLLLISYVLRCHEYLQLISTKDRMETRRDIYHIWLGVFIKQSCYRSWKKKKERKRIILGLIDEWLGKSILKVSSKKKKLIDIHLEIFFIIKVKREKIYLPAWEM